ncbi:peptidoglycan DD-metalloendopeptidase family protein [Rickettsiales bacterium LUAb2]
MLLKYKKILVLILTFFSCSGVAYASSYPQPSDDAIMPPGILKPNTAPVNTTNKSTDNKAASIKNNTDTSNNLNDIPSYKNDPDVINKDDANSLLKPVTSNVNNSKDDTVAAPVDDSASEGDESDQQADGYSKITHWMLQNQNNFDKVLKNTAKVSKTKWIIDEQSSNKDAASKSNDEIKTEQTSDAIYHLVKAKETLFSIAKLYGVTTSDLIKLNGLPNNDIKIGQNLLIKQGLTSENKSVDFNYPEYKYYKIQVGDTLSSVGRQFEMTNDEIMKLNNMPNTMVYPGKVLKVKARYSEEREQREISFNWPLVGRLLVGFGPQKTGMVNEGINIMAKKNSDVKSVADGVVVYVGNGLKGFGNLILIQHPNHWVSVYAHIDNIVVKKGEEVKQGEIIAKVSGDDNKTPQLHFELRKNVTPKDPLDYLNSYT